MDDMNDFRSWDQASKVYVKLKNIVDIKDFLLSA